MLLVLAAVWSTSLALAHPAPLPPETPDHRPYKLQSLFGPRLISNQATKLNIHGGIDFGDPPVAGDPVRAFDGGTIEELDQIQEEAFQAAVKIRIDNSGDPMHRFRYLHLFSHEAAVSYQLTSKQGGVP